MWIDTHAHVSCMDNPIEVAKRAKEAGVEAIVNICTDLETLDRGIELREACPFVYNVASTTPHDVDEHGEKEWERFAKAARSGQLVAVGETGLDLFGKHAPCKKQEELLARYCALALETNLPLVIHCRDAFEPFFEVMRAEYFGKPGALPGILHCFTGSEAEARAGIAEGWYVSLSGILTFKNGAGLREVAKALPLEHLVIETDAPWLAPQSRRGQTNEPAWVIEVGEVLAEVKGIERAEVARATTANAQRIFKI